MHNPIYPLAAPVRVTQILLMDFVVESQIRYLPVINIPENCLKIEIYGVFQSTYVGAAFDPVFVDFNLDAVAANYFSAYHFAGTSHGMSSGNNNLQGSFAGNTNAAFSDYYFWCVRPRQIGNGHLHTLHSTGSAWRSDGYWNVQTIIRWSIANQPLDNLRFSLQNGNFTKGCSIVAMATVFE